MSDEPTEIAAGVVAAWLADIGSKYDRRDRHELLALHIAGALRCAAWAGRDVSERKRKRLRAALEKIATWAHEKVADDIRRLLAEDAE